jgi:ATP-dependent Clp protease ATP-binding subunit ClpA
VFERFSEQAHAAVDLAREEAERAGHRYLGPEHLVLGLVADRHHSAAQLLRAHGVELERARAALAGLARRGVVPAPRPSDADLLGALGVDLEAVRHRTEQAFGARAVGQATWLVTRRRWWRGGRVTWTPLCGPPFFAKRALQLASEQVRTLGRGAVTPEHLLAGVLADARKPAGNVRVPRRHRRILAHVGLPAGYQGAAGPLLHALGVDLDALWESVTAELRGSRS